MDYNQTEVHEQTCNDSVDNDCDGTVDESYTIGNSTNISTTTIAANALYRKYGEKRKRHWSLFESLIRIFGLLLSFTPLYRVGYKNATDIVLNRINLEFTDLPEAFHGYKLLHLTDLHIDFITGMEGITYEFIADVEPYIYIATLSVSDL